MGYLHITNLYKEQYILMFKECYALEKIHGTSAHISWDAEKKQIKYFSGGENHVNFVKIFDNEFLIKKFSEMFITQNVIIFGEAYGGKQQGMSSTYGKELKFIGFDVKIDKMWLNVPNAHSICESLNIEFVDYVKCSTDLESLNYQRDRDSVQAIRNGCGEGKLREGVVLKPLIEFTMNNGERVIVKHKRDEFRETKTPRVVNSEDLLVLTNAKMIADEWATEQRLYHVLDKLPEYNDMTGIKTIIEAMVNDIYREGKDEIVESKEVFKAIANKTVILFKNKLKKI